MTNQQLHWERTNLFIFWILKISRGNSPPPLPLPWLLHWSVTKFSEAKVTNQQLHWDLFQQLIATNPDFFGRDPNCFVYDCSQLLFSTIPLPLDLHGSDSESATREFVLELDDELLNERCRAFVRSIDSIKAVIELTEHIDLTMSNVQSMLARGDRSAVHFLELLTSQQMFKKWVVTYELPLGDVCFLSWIW